MTPLEDRVAIVTGASRGIGKAIAAALAARGARVAICARDAEAVRKSADEIAPSGGQVLAFRADICQPADVRELVRNVVARWGRIHIVVNNAGVNARVPVESGDDQAWLAILHGNLLGTYYVTREVLKSMPAHDGGRIINISSILGRFGVPGYTAYCTAKHGVLGFTRALALELADRGITVNAVCPGWVETAMAAHGMAETATVLGISKETFREQALAAVPLRRILEPAEIGELVAYLASDAASGMTGQALNLCGGQVMS